MPTQLTVEQYWTSLGIPFKNIPDWPPDLFAICASTLKKSGAYATLLGRSRWQWARDVSKTEREREIKDTGALWRKTLVEGKPLVTQEFWRDIEARWQVLTDNSSLEIHKIDSHVKLVEALLDLLAISDEASQGLGLPDGKGGNRFLEEADERLLPDELGSTLCKSIPTSTLRVLPKMHTAQVSLTPRSLSHHLALCESDEVRPSWISVPGSRGNENDTARMNIVIAPWPRKLLPQQISEYRPNKFDANYRFFEFDIRSRNGKLVEESLALVARAEELVGQVDAVVFPELAMTTREYRQVRAVLLRKGILTIAGVGSKARASNYLAFDVPISPYHAVHFRQRKHHRWKLEKSQISAYHLGSRLDPNKEYWEHIGVQDRKLNFVVLRPWVVATALICEDLARHDPVGELLKSVGPNLVLALLMDGPQLSGRWPGRYASVLADDPGCSVLSITSLGMSEMSRPAGKDGRDSRKIALWKDATGNTTEIDLPKGSDGVVLTLSMKPGSEWTADYRLNKSAMYLSLSGHHFLDLPSDTSVFAPNELPQPKWISRNEASFLARLVQRDGLHQDFMPDGMEHLRGTAFRIGCEVWRRKAAGSATADKFLKKVDEGGMWADREERETAGHILNWQKTNNSGEDFFPRPEERSDGIAGASCGS